VAVAVAACATAVRAAARAEVEMAVAATGSTVARLTWARSARLSWKGLGWEEAATVQASGSTVRQLAVAAARVAKEAAMVAQCMALGRANVTRSASARAASRAAARLATERAGTGRAGSGEGRRAKVRAA
jgi:hypothetical protein